MLTLKESMELAGRNLINALSPAHGYLPYWCVKVDGANKQCTPMMNWPAHNIGRWWDALLRLEAATGFTIPEDLEEAMLQHIERCLDNPFELAGYILREPVGWIDAHSQREFLLALACLVRYRNSCWAALAGSRLIRALDRYIRGDGCWDIKSLKRLARQRGISVDKSASAKLELRGIELTASHGRMLEGVLEFFLSTGDVAALRLADRLARFHYDVSTRPDGRVPETDGYLHTHSLFGTYRGLLLYGQLTRQHRYVDRILKTYMATVRTSVKQSGFISHDWGRDTKGETTCPGDAAQLALWLVKAGYSELLDDAERIVRSRILPSQITEPPGFMLPPGDGAGPNVPADDLVIGAYGGVHSHPHGGTLPTTDITAADLHTLCDVYNNIVENTELGLRINFHFDYEDWRIRIETNRGHSGRLTVQPKKSGLVFIRLPSWAPVDSIHLSVNGKTIGRIWAGSYLVTAVQNANTQIELEYELPISTVSEVTDVVEYRFKWKGDDVAGISPNTDFLPFYPTLWE